MLNHYLVDPKSSINILFYLNTAKEVGRVSLTWIFILNELFPQEDRSLSYLWNYSIMNTFFFFLAVKVYIRLQDKLVLHLLILHTLKLFKMSFM